MIFLPGHISKHGHFDIVQTCWHRYSHVARNCCVQNASLHIDSTALKIQSKLLHRLVTTLKCDVAKAFAQPSLGITLQFPDVVYASAVALQGVTAKRLTPPPSVQFILQHMAVMEGGESNKNKTNPENLNWNRFNFKHANRQLRTGLRFETVRVLGWLF